MPLKSLIWIPTHNQTVVFKPHTVSKRDGRTIRYGGHIDPTADELPDKGHVVSRTRGGPATVSDLTIKGFNKGSEGTCRKTRGKFIVKRIAH